MCPICKGQGFLVLDVPYGHPDFGKLIACRCTEARIALEPQPGVARAEQPGRAGPDDVRHVPARRRQPARVGAPALHQAFDICLEYAKRPRGWLVLLGGYGAGKTHLAAAITNYNIDLGRPAIFVVVPDLLDHLRAAFGPTSESGVDERLETIRETPLLILDDLGAHHSTPWAQEKLFQILNHRYNSRLPTVITTNQRLEELDPRIGSRLADLDLSQIFEIPAPDFRQGGGGSSARSRRAQPELARACTRIKPSTTSRCAGTRTSTQPARRIWRAPSTRRATLRIIRTAGWCSAERTAAARPILRQRSRTTRWRRDGQTPMFVVVPDLLDHLRATFSPTAGVTLDRVFEQVKAASLLVLDDLGTESATPWARREAVPVAQSPVRRPAADRHHDDVADQRDRRPAAEPNVGHDPLHVLRHHGAELPGQRGVRRGAARGLAGGAGNPARALARTRQSRFAAVSGSVRHWHYGALGKLR